MRKPSVKKKNLDWEERHAQEEKSTASTWEPWNLTGLDNVQLENKHISWVVYNKLHLYKDNIFRALLQSRCRTCLTAQKFSHFLWPCFTCTPSGMIPAAYTLVSANGCMQHGTFCASDSPQPNSPQHSHLVVVAVIHSLALLMDSLLYGSAIAYLPLHVL